MQLGIIIFNNFKDIDYYSRDVSLYFF